MIPKVPQETPRGLQRLQKEQKMCPKCSQVMPERPPKGFWYEGVAGDAPQALSIRPPPWGRPCRTSGRRAFSSILSLQGLGAFRRARSDRGLFYNSCAKNVAKSVLNALCCGLPTSYATYTARQPDFQTIFFQFPTFQISKINVFRRECRHF